jgi:hypothetical protein
MRKWRSGRNGNFARIFRRIVKNLARNLDVRAAIALRPARMWIKDRCIRRGKLLKGCIVPIRARMARKYLRARQRIGLIIGNDQVFCMWHWKRWKSRYWCSIPRRSEPHSRLVAEVCRVNEHRHLEQKSHRIELGSLTSNIRKVFMDRRILDSEEGSGASSCTAVYREALNMTCIVLLKRWPLL